MKNYTILGLLGVIALAVLSTQFLFKNADPIDELSQSQTTNSKNATMVLDPETGEIMTDPDKIEKLKANPQSTAQNQAKDKNKEMKMTEMDNGALKIDLGQRYVRPNKATVDENGNLIQKGHTELDSQESK